MLRLCLASVMAIGILFSAMPAQADWRRPFVAKAGKWVGESAEHFAFHGAFHGVMHLFKDWRGEEPAERERGRATPFP
jgi:hypothetical protein